MFKYNPFLLTLILATFVGYGCAVTPDADNPGKCNLDCSAGAVIGSASAMKIEKISADLNFQCGTVTTATSIGRPVTVKFKVSNEKGGSPLDGDQGDDLNADVPISNMSFAPVIIGARDPASTSTEVATVTNNGTTTVVDPYEYHGIVTPKSEWCSDACGVATIEYVPLCLTSEQTITTTIASGSLNGSDDVHTTTMQVEAATNP